MCVVVLLDLVAHSRVVHSGNRARRREVGKEAAQSRCGRLGALLLRWWRRRWRWRWGGRRRRWGRWHGRRWRVGDVRRRWRRQVTDPIVLIVVDTVLPVSRSQAVVHLQPVEPVLVVKVVVLGSGRRGRGLLLHGRRWRWDRRRWRGSRRRRRWWWWWVGARRRRWRWRWWRRRRGRRRWWWWSLALLLSGLVVAPKSVVQQAVESELVLQVAIAVGALQGPPAPGPRVRELVEVPIVPKIRFCNGTGGQKKKNCARSEERGQGFAAHGSFGWVEAARYGSLWPVSGGNPGLGPCLHRSTPTRTGFDVQRSGLCTCPADSYTQGFRPAGDERLNLARIHEIA